jgi:hypothetical protein
MFNEKRRSSLSLVGMRREGAFVESEGLGDRREKTSPLSQALETFGAMPELAYHLSRASL